MRARIRWSNVVLSLALALAPAAAAPWLARWHWLVDLAANFVVQVTGTLLLATMALAAARRWRAMALVGAAAGLGLAAALPPFLASPNPGPADGPTVRVLSLNLLRENDGNVAQALAAVRAFAPDVVFCSEVTPAWQRGLDAGLVDFPHRIARADGGWFGVALYAKLPLHDAAVLPLGYAWAPCIRATVATPHGPLGVLGIHTPRPGSALRNEERDRALAAVPDLVKALGPHVLVLGDCNATTWTPAFQDLLTRTGLRAAGDGRFAPTWPAHVPLPLRIRIDHALLGQGLGVVDFAVGEPFGSDHLPLFVELRLPRT
ncbi:MAG: endonuclease/exonuclease/phosphatase family protein [Planctomycetes bacterium]|nr:endonuclease/exonuclease/phosphatase family protein [Planctomycetota bacterium]